MHLALIGASGRTGRPLAAQALAAGHTVAALVRDPKRLPLTDARLTVVTGDVLAPADVARTVRGADAVLVTLGHTAGSPDDLMARAAQTIVAAMRDAGVRRVVTETGAGVADPRDPGGLGPAVVRGVMRVVAATLLADSVAHVDAFRASGLAWTAVRAPRLTEGPLTGRARTGYFAMGLGHSVSRADVAAVMLRLAASQEYAGEAPMVTGG